MENEESSLWFKFKMTKFVRFPISSGTLEIEQLFASILFNFVRFPIKAYLITFYYIFIRID